MNLKTKYVLSPLLILSLSTSSILYATADSSNDPPSENTDTVSAYSTNGDITSPQIYNINNIDNIDNIDYIDYIYPVIEPRCYSVPPFIRFNSSPDDLYNYSSNIPISVNIKPHYELSIPQDIVLDIDGNNKEKLTDEPLKLDFSISTNNLLLPKNSKIYVTNANSKITLNDSKFHDNLTISRVKDKVTFSPDKVLKDSSKSAKSIDFKILNNDIYAGNFSSNTFFNVEVKYKKIKHN